MVTYDFYENIYMGSQLSQTAFEKTVARAEDYISAMERTYEVITFGPDSRAMAVCAVAEQMDKQGPEAGVSAASVGKVSIHYREHREKALYRSACMYLDVRRGVC